MSLNKHIHSQFDAELNELNSNVLEMGCLVAQQVVPAVTTLITRDLVLAAEVKAIEKRIDTLELSIDEQCARILAIRNPAARDLRCILAISRISSDLERAGDESNKIAKALRKDRVFGTELIIKENLLLIAEAVQAMIETAMQAFENSDVDLAIEVIRKDKVVDKDYAQGLQTVVEMMRKHSDNVDNGVDTIVVLRALERIGDHAKNIAEQVVYHILGKEVRHVSAKALLKRITGP